jgi:HlyD family secretion protein
MTAGFRIGALAVLVLVAGGSVYAVYDARVRARHMAPLIGMVRRTEIRIGPELSGRLGRIVVAPGDRIVEGEDLAELEAPDLAASLGQAQASTASTAADRANLYAGVRREEQEIADKQIEVAAANLAFAKDELGRAGALAAKGFESRERLDQANANFDSDSAALALKKAAYAEAVAGPTAEQRKIADARLAEAEAGANTVAAHLAKTRLRSPVAGTVKTLIGVPGEIVRAGETVLTVVPNERPWFTFTVREDRLDGVAIGATLDMLRTDGKKLTARVTELRPLGDFATWQAARAVGDHDLNSFYVRLEPVSDANDDLDAGMSVWLMR